MNLKLKLGLGYLVMGILLAVSGFIGYQSTLKLSQVTDFLVTDAKDTIEGALTTSANVQRQLHLIDELLSDKATSKNTAELKQLNEQIKQAYKNIEASNLFPKQELEVYKNAQTVFENAQTPLLDTNALYRNAYQEFGANAELINKLMLSITAMVNRIIVERETSNDEEAESGDMQSEEFFTASAATEARLALFSQLYYFQRYALNQNRQQASQAINEAVQI